jgi:FSR family fosmidomycin resistance protein-like MFS transporter
MTLLRNHTLLAVTLGHFTVDAFNGMLPILYPLLVGRLHLSYAQVGLTITVFGLAASLPQPLFGYLTDRVGSRWLAPLSTLWLAGALGLAGLSPNYLALVSLVCLAGLASAAYHPQGVVAASLASQDRRASAVSIFTLGGNMGFSLGPLIGATLFTQAGASGSLVVIVPALFVAAALYHSLGRTTEATPTRDGHPPGGATGLAAPSAGGLAAPSAGGLAALIAIITVRAWVQTSLSNYLPLLARSRGNSLVQASQLLFLVLLALAVGGLLAGFLSDRIGRRPVLLFSMTGLAPLVGLVLFGPGPVPFLAAVPAGLLLGASLPVTLVMTQELLPRSLGVASGVAFGLSFTAGAIGAAITGLVADHAGLPAAMAILALLPVIGAAGAFLLPSVKRRAPPLPTTLTEY